MDFNRDSERDFPQDMELAARLKGAVDRISEPEGFDFRVRAALAGRRQRSRPWIWVGPLAAATVAAGLLIGVVTPVPCRPLPSGREAQENFIGAISRQTPALLQAGLQDHVHCSVFRARPSTLPSVAELRKTLGLQYGALLDAVAGHAPDGFHVVTAHRCGYRGHKFIHLALTDGGKLMSLVVSLKQGSESLRESDLKQALSSQGIPIYAAGAERFHIAAFETPSYLVSVVSDLSSGGNNHAAQVLAPPVNTALSQL
jgi:hypothetical protein